MQEEENQLSWMLKEFVVLLVSIRPASTFHSLTTLIFDRNEARMPLKLLFVVYVSTQRTLLITYLARHVWMLIFIDVLIKDLQRPVYLASQNPIWQPLCAASKAGVQSARLHARFHANSRFACSYSSTLRFRSTKPRWFHRQQRDHQMQHSAVRQRVRQSDFVAGGTNAQHLSERGGRWVIWALEFEKFESPHWGRSLRGMLAKRKTFCGQVNKLKSIPGNV